MSSAFVVEFVLFSFSAAAFTYGVCGLTGCWLVVVFLWVFLFVGFLLFFIFFPHCFVDYIQYL